MVDIPVKIWVPFFWGPLDGSEIRLKSSTTEYKIPLPEPSAADFDGSATTGEIVVPKLRCQKYVVKSKTIGGKLIRGMWYVGEEDV